MRYHLMSCHQLAEFAPPLDELPQRAALQHAPEKGERGSQLLFVD